MSVKGESSAMPRQDDTVQYHRTFFSEVLPAVTWQELRATGTASHQTFHLTNSLPRYPNEHQHHLMHQHRSSHVSSISRSISPTRSHDNPNEYQHHPMHHHHHQVGFTLAERASHTTQCIIAMPTKRASRSVHDIFFFCPRPSAAPSSVTASSAHALSFVFTFRVHNHFPSSLTAIP